MSNFKGFVFTLDAIFALIVAAAATSLLLLSLYTPATQIQGTQSEALAVSQSFMQSTLGQAAAGRGLALVAVSKWNSAQYTWPQYGYGANVSSSTPSSGPAYPFVLFSYQTFNAINPAPAVADGLLVFSTNGTRSYLYALNATTGSLVFNVLPPNAVTGTFISDPVIFNHFIYTLTANNFIVAYTENGQMLWGTQIRYSWGGIFPFEFENSLRSILDVEGGSLETNMTLTNPANGVEYAAASTTASSPLYLNVPMVYGNGRYSGLAYTYCQSGSYSCYTPEIAWNYGSSITAVNTSLMGPIMYFTPAITPVSSFGNTMYFGYSPYYSGIAGTPYPALYAVNTNGTVLWNAMLAYYSPMIGGPAASNGSVYLGAGNTVYGYAQNGNRLFKSLGVQGYINATPTLTSNALYVLSNGNVLQDFNPITGAMIWNATLPSQAPVPINALTDIAVAYGNAYVAVGNMIYAIGTCSADPNGSLLQALTTMYLNTAGACATQILNQSYGYGKVALLINNTYAPSLKAAAFTGNSYLYEINASQKIYSTLFSMSVWVYLPADSTSNGFIAGMIDQSKTHGFYLQQNANSNSITSFVGIPGYGASLAYAANILPDSWTHVVITYNGIALITYINGAAVRSQAFASCSPPSACPPYLSEYGIPLTVGGSAVLGTYMTGDVQDLQLYNYALSQSQAQQLYSEGTGGVPLQGAVAWLPLDGDSNDYEGFAVFQSNSVRYTAVPSMPPGLQSSYQISRSTVPLTINVNGNYTNRNVSVVVWR